MIKSFEKIAIKIIFKVWNKFNKTLIYSPNELHYLYSKCILTSILIPAPVII